MSATPTPATFTRCAGAKTCVRQSGHRLNRQRFAWLKRMTLGTKAMMPRGEVTAAGVRWYRAWNGSPCPTCSDVIGTRRRRGKTFGLKCVDCGRVTYHAEKGGRSK